MSARSRWRNEFHFVAPVYARSGERMAELVEDGNGEKLAFSNLAIGSVKYASVCIDRRELHVAIRCIGHLHLRAETALPSLLLKSTEAPKL